MKNTELMLALDLNDLSEVKHLLTEVSGSVSHFKIGLRLYLKEGNSVIGLIRNHGKVFLDLKFHDIPNTVYNAVSESVKYGVDFVDVHASGGSEMMTAACKAVTGTKTKVLGVTVLTSLSDRELYDEVKCTLSVDKMVSSLAQLAKNSGLHGVVASARELTALRALLGADFIIATPGIRLSEGGETNDQKRVETPAQAARNGADYIIVGRPILESSDKKGIITKFKDQLKEANRGF
ncbi:MAG: orotidine-5'-phosphate decarboxylase [Candidatus Wallbacteria bacterium]|nr:orotidine-5'-phosphate decarboxylase [Candidatus Wallbacteria bacterium]